MSSFAQKIDLPFPTPKEPIYTAEDYALGLWESKYPVKVDSQSFYIYDLEVAAGIRSGEERCLNKACTPDITVYHYQPIMDGRVERTEEELL